ncbi:MAG: hypothetical protein HQK81_11570 [Desulfovibrionaceae bacterium]|nr:hypothetical protein [Desulfovibrionaceae bacterium]MBF0514682.1 hypothetical protein [Desulfovibrionaceae bacterium]
MARSKILLAATLISFVFLLGAQAPARAAEMTPEAAKNDKVVRDCMDNMVKGCELVVKGSDLVAKGDKDSVAKGQAMIQKGKARIDEGKNDYGAWIEEQQKKYGSGN